MQRTTSPPWPWQLNNNEDKAIAETVDRLNSLLTEEQRVMEWREMNEVMVSQMDADNKSGQIMLGILYLVIAFGVFGTVLMLTAERKREFGVLVAIGMQKKKLASIMTLEMLLIGLLGMLAGCCCSHPAHSLRCGTSPHLQGRNGHDV